MAEATSDKKPEKPSSEKPSTEKSTSEGSGARRAAAKTQNGQDQWETGGDPIEMLKQDHRTVEALFEAFQSAGSRAKKMECIREIVREMTIHAKLEEEIFYPACREASDDDDALDEAQVEHDTAKILMANLLDNNGSDAFFKAKVMVLKEYIQHHVKEEEEASSGIFAKAKKAGLDGEQLVERMRARRAELKEHYAGEDLEPPTPVTLPAPQQGVTHMRDDEDRRSSRSGRSGRDEGPFRDRTGRMHASDGRFLSDDDRRGGGGGYSRSSSYRDDDDDRRGGGGYSRSSSYRDDDDDRRGSGGGYSRSSSYRDDDDDRRGGGYSRSSGYRDDDDDRRSGGGYSRSSYRDDDDDRRGGGSSRSRDDDGHDGPFRDRMGRMHQSDGRFMSEDDDDRSGRSSGGGGRSRYRDDDDDRRSSYSSRRNTDR